MNTTLLVVSGIIAGIAGALLPGKRRSTSSRPGKQPKITAKKTLEQDLSPFIYFRS